MTTDFPRPRLADAEAARAASRPKTRAERKAELTRMRAVATGLLAAMTGLFVVTRHASWPLAPYLHAFAEAGMVGACADWFAVTAIFRRPFGLPIPHTAVVPENKKRLGAALGHFVEQNFLDPRVALRRLRRVDLAGLAARWLAEARNARSLAAWAGRVAPYVLAHLPRETLARWAAQAARKGLEAMPLAPLASRALAVLWAQGAAQEALDYAVDALEGALERNRAIIVAAVRGRSSRWIPRFVDEIVADKLIAGLSQTLKEMRTPGHPWRSEVEARVAKLIEQLAHDPAWRTRAEALKREVFESPVFVKQLESLGAELQEVLTRESSGRAEAFAAAAHNAAGALARWLDDDPARRARLNRTLRLWALRAVLPRRAEIGVYIAEVVDRWDTATLVERLELQVGKDLQYIRVNGTLVGGLVGLAIYVLSERLG
jgi:uncharacterized membrane-anchored protein YjiN (DUF445 family)